MNGALERFNSSNFEERPLTVVCLAYEQAVMFWFCLLLLTVPSQPSVLPPTAAYGRKLLELKKAIFTSLIKIINISNCRQEKGGTKIWSVWFLRWHEVTHATTSIIKIVYSNWRPQIKKYLHVLHGLLHMKDVHTHRGSFAITVGILLFHIWVNF